MTIRKKSIPELQDLRQQAANRYAALGEAMVAEYGILKVEPSAGLRGWAIVKDRHIKVPWPTTTRKRLYILAHECGHVFLEHTGRRKPRYVEEYEAEQFAIAKLREHGIPVPKSMLKRAKAYVAYKIRQAERSGAKKIDTKIRNWCG